MIGSPLYVRIFVYAVVQVAKRSKTTRRDKSMRTSLVVGEEQKQFHSIVPASVIDQWDETLEMLLLELNSPRSRRSYATDVRIFRSWLDEHNISVAQFGYDDVVRYRAYLVGAFSNTSAAHRFVVMRRFLAVAVRRGIIPTNPTIGVKGIKTDNASPHSALTKDEAKRLLAAIDRATPIGIRNYAILMVLLYTGIRRSECVHLKIGDIVFQQEHRVLAVLHGKGDKRRYIPVRVDVFRAIKEYLIATDRMNESPDAPLFKGFSRTERYKDQPISDNVIFNIVRQTASKAGIWCTPHDLRASFATYAIDTNSPLIQVQRLMGHANPATTERYYTRKMDLDTSPVYKIDLDN
jgi:site-specific recombinase XerD